MCKIRTHNKTYFIFSEILLLLFICFYAASNSYARELFVSGCGNLDNAYGPYDYTSPIAHKEMLPIVEKHHLTPNVLNLEQGETGSIMTDLDYTLRAFPNHHVALYTLGRYALREGYKFNPKYYTVDCYFKRAMAFKPDDGYVYMIYGLYLQKSGDYKKALKEYTVALKLLPENAELYYNMGLLYNEAEKYANKAYELGYPLPGLRDILKKHKSESH